MSTHPTPFLSPALVALRRELDAIAPGRSRSHDGWIGDAAHLTRKSDHNPRADGEVCAVDLTHDPRGGLDAAKVLDQLIAGRDPRIKYLIHNGQIIAGDDGPQPWKLRPYSGSNPHRTHLHVSVKPDRDSGPWRLGGIAGSDTAPLHLPVTERVLGASVTAPCTFTPGDQLVSANGRHRFVMQGDGNAVLYRDGAPVWQTRVRGDRIALQPDGNLVLYRGETAIWASGSVHPHPSRVVRLDMQDDGVLATYGDGARWAAWAA